MRHQEAGFAGITILTSWSGIDFAILEFPNMNKKKNCWEILKCGYSPNGNVPSPDNVCPVIIARAADGVNEGKMAGRICWAISGTRCYGEVQKSFEDKEFMCLNCKVFKKVLREEGLSRIRLFLNK